MNYFTSISLSCQTIYFDRSVFTCITIPILFSFFNKCISIMIRKNMGCPLKYSDLSRNAVNMVHFRLHDGWFALQIRCHVVLWLHWWHFFDICLILWTWWSNDLQSKWMSKVICVLWKQRFKYILIRIKISILCLDFKNNKSFLNLNIHLWMTHLQYIGRFHWKFYKSIPRNLTKYDTFLFYLSLIHYFNLD